VVPPGTTSIPQGAFNNCDSLTSISLPDGLLSLGTMSFYGINSLDSLILPSSVTSIDHGAFRYSSGLQSILLPDGLQSIGIYAFANIGSSLETVYVPPGCTVGGWAFSNTPGGYVVGHAPMPPPPSPPIPPSVPPPSPDP
jgi:hypothetical protein